MKAIQVGVFLIHASIQGESSTYGDWNSTRYFHQKCLRPNFKKILLQNIVYIDFKLNFMVQIEITESYLPSEAVVKYRDFERPPTAFSYTGSGRGSEYSRKWYVDDGMTGRMFRLNPWKYIVIAFRADTEISLKLDLEVRYLTLVWKHPIFIGLFSLHSLDIHM